MTETFVVAGTSYSARASVAFNTAYSAAKLLATLFGRPVELRSTRNTTLLVSPAYAVLIK